MKKIFFLIFCLILISNLFSLEKPVLIFEEYERVISNCSKRGGRIIIYPSITENDYTIDQTQKYEWIIIEGQSGTSIASGTYEDNKKYYFFNTWINNIKLWLKSHFEIGWKKCATCCKFGFRIKDISEPIYIIIQVKIFFENNYYGIWQKEFKGAVRKYKKDDEAVKLDPKLLGKWGYIDQSDVILTEHNFETEEVEPDPIPDDNDNDIEPDPDPVVDPDPEPDPDPILEPEPEPEEEENKKESLLTKIIKFFINLFKSIFSKE